MSGDNHTPEGNLTGWMTETRQQGRDLEDQKHVPRRTERDECFATLPLGGQDQFRVKMKAEMNKEYNEFLSKQKLGRRTIPAEPTPLSDDRARSHIPIPKNYLEKRSADERGRRRGEELEHERGELRDYDSHRKEPLGPPPLAPRYDPLEELRLRRYFEDQLYRPRQEYQEYHGYPPPPPVPDGYRYNPYVSYYQQMDRAWAPERDARRSPPRREKRVTFPEEWPEESDLYGWAQQGRRSEMRLRECEREEQRVERRGSSVSPLNRSRSAPPDKKERSAGGFMDGFGSGNRGRDEEKRRREDYARELKEQIRNKQIKQSVAIGEKRVTRSRPPTPPSHKHLYESPPSKQQSLSSADPLDYYKSAVQPDHHTEREYSRFDEEKTPEQKQTYRQVLEQQIEEGKQRKEQRAKELAKSRAEPVEEWSPWGKGGGGAPLKDSTGRVVADLKVLNKAYQVREKTGSSPKLEELADICVLKSSVSPAQKTLAPYEVTTPTPSPSKKETAVTPQQEYREYLRQQVEEKKAKKQEEEARKREEDRKEVERLEKERIKLQEDYRREVEKQREKEEAIRKKNEELKLAAELRKNAPSPARRGRARERRSSPPPDPAPLPAPIQPREYSPPIPTLRNTPRPQQPPEYPSHDVRSPPIPALRRNTRELTPPSQPLPPASPPHVPIKNSDTMELLGAAPPFSPQPVYTLPNADIPADSHVRESEDSRSDVVRQLTDMKQQLRYEKDRVKEQLELSRTTYQDMADLLSSRSQQLAPKISHTAKPPFKIRKSVIPVKPPVEQQEMGSKGSSVKREERRTVGFHLQNTQPQNKAYHREYTPLLKGRGTPPTQNRPDSTGSNVSISTLEIEALALKNDNRMKRLESLLKSNQELEIRKPSPESIINQLLTNGPGRQGHLPRVTPDKKTSLSNFTL